ncbi:hypothetical protein [Candidatus Chlorohelix sp.]|uniref:hypothetical protein n=1 Tax=Candidatus Chlorohelix sp. TaxID=3139201 RepID=UPI00303032A0
MLLRIIAMLGINGQSLCCSCKTGDKRGSTQERVVGGTSKTGFLKMRRWNLATPTRG